MNKKSKLLLIVSAAAMGLVATSCGNEPAGSSEDNSSQNSTISAATRISHDELPYITIGDVLDLDQYITIKYEDNSSDHKFSVTCTNSAVSIDGHSVIATEAGTYNLLIKAGSLQAKLSLQVVTEEHMELINFLDPLADNPQNFTIDLFASDYIYSAIHTENYVGIYNIYDPAEKVKDKKGNETDEYNSTILAKLADGHAYWGHIEGTAKNPVPVFDPGYASWNNYYITQSLSLDATDFEVTDLSDMGVEEPALVSSSSFEDSFMSVGLSRPESSIKQYGYSWAGMLFLGLQDNNTDGEDDGALFMALINETKDDGTTELGAFCYVQIRNIGTTDVDFLRNTTSDASYVPAIPKADEITTVFDQINQGKNYTVTLEMYSADDKGNPLAAPASKDGTVMLTGVSYAKTVTTVTETGIHSIVENKKAEEVDGKVTVSELAKAGELAYWTDGTNCYTSSLGKDDTMSAKEQVQEGTDVLSIEAVKPNTAQNVTANEINNTVWTKKTTNGTKVTMKGQCGDNDNAGTVTDLLFVALFNMSPFYQMGTFFGKAEQFTNGEYGALISMSNYEEVTVDTATKDVTVFVNAYLPFSDVNNKNMGLKLTISNVGTTTNDFSTLK